MVSDTVAIDTAQTVEDTLTVISIDTVESQKTTQVHEMHRDTAEMTNLRILARKQRTIYSPSLMVGEWQRETLHELYYADGSGRYWDTKEDVSREEAQSFRWTMDSNLLLMEIPMEMGGVIYRQLLLSAKCGHFFATIQSAVNLRNQESSKPPTVLSASLGGAPRACSSTLSQSFSGCSRNPWTSM